MKAQAVAFSAPRRAELVSVEVPESLAADELLIETHTTLISAGTERKFFGAAPFYPFRPGYSVAGVVLQAGAQVSRFRPGDRVFAVASHASHVKCREAAAVTIPADLDFERASFGTVGAMAMHATRAAGIALCEPVAILGQGLIGLISLQLARLSGALPLIGIELDVARLELSRRLGADQVYDGRDAAAIRSAARALPGGGVEAVIELTASAGAVELAIDITRERGRVFLGSVGQDSDWRADVYGAMWMKGISLIGGYVNSKPHALRQTQMQMHGWPPAPEPGPAHFGTGSWTSEADTIAVLELIRHGRVDVRPLITQRLSPRDAPHAFDSLGAGDPTLLGAVFHWR